MATARKPLISGRAQRPIPPPQQEEPILHGDVAVLSHWLTYYWQELRLPAQEFPLLAMTQDRREYVRWTGKRLNSMALGCYCYLPPAASLTQRRRYVPDTYQQSPQHRHLIFIEPDMQSTSIEVTIAHELIHLADRVHGTPRRHRHHGYDSIAADEAAITGYDLEQLRKLLHEESMRREQIRRERQPIRYLYACPHCGKTYPRVRKYSHPVSCSICDKSYNPLYQLSLQIS